MYSSVQDVRSALFPGAGAAPAEDKSTAASLPDDQITSAINEADSMINTYLGVPSSHSVPMDGAVAATPIRYWSRNIAAYLATLTFRKGKDLGQDDPVRLRYADTIAILAMIRDDKADNPLPGPDVPSGEGQPLVINQYDGTLFGPQDFFGPTRPSLIPGQRRIWPGY